MVIVTSLYVFLVPRAEGGLYSYLQPPHPTGDTSASEYWVGRDHLLGPVCFIKDLKVTLGYLDRSSLISRQVAD